MAEIRAITTVATTANFAGLGAPTHCAPLLYDTTTGDLYALLSPDTVALVGSVAGGSSHTIAGEVFGKHVVPPVMSGNASDIMQSEIFGKHAIPQAVLGNASDLIQGQVFFRKHVPAMWS